MFNEIHVGDQVQFTRGGSLITAKVDEIFSHVLLCEDQKGRTYTPSRFEVRIVGR